MGLGHFRRVARCVLNVKLATLYNAIGANENSPSPRHRIKTEPQERSIRFPCCASLVT
jgi:hypothetical protein